MRTRTRAFSVAAAAFVAALSCAGIAMGAGLVTPAPAPAQPWCASTTDMTSRILVASIARLASDSGDVFVEARAALGDMPQVAVEEVAPIGDEALCERASRMLDSTLFVTPRRSPVYMLGVGRRYGIVPTDTAARMGEYGTIIYTDTAFTVLARGML